MIQDALTDLIHLRSSRVTSSPLSTSNGFLFFHKALTVSPITPKIMRNQLTHIFVISSPSGTSYRNLKYNPPKIRIAAKIAIKYLISNCTQLTPSAVHSFTHGATVRSNGSSVSQVL
jgi:hypothetical protein